MKRPVQWFPVMFRGVVHLTLARVNGDEEPEEDPDIWSIYPLDGVHGIEKPGLNPDDMDDAEHEAFVNELHAMAFNAAHPSWADFAHWRDERFPKAVTT